MPAPHVRNASLDSVQVVVPVSQQSPHHLQTLRPQLRDQPLLVEPVHGLPDLLHDLQPTIRRVVSGAWAGTYLEGLQAKPRRCCFRRAWIASHGIVWGLYGALKTTSTPRRRAVSSTTTYHVDQRIIKERNG